MSSERDSDMVLSNAGCNETGEIENEPKKPRIRKKNLYKRVAQQMDFYFSDSNLSQDRFLKKEYDSVNGDFLPLEMFLKFNRMKQLGVTAEDIGKAVIKFSQHLCVDESKTKVKRTTSYTPPVNVDARTIYVEGLPANVDHDWIRSTLSAYGDINYVSLPKYRSTMQPKGFAFVEFAAEKSAKRCLKSIGTKEFASVSPFPKAGSKDIQRMQKAVCKTSDTLNSNQHTKKARKKGIAGEVSQAQEVLTKKDTGQHEQCSKADEHTEKKNVTDEPSTTAEQKTGKKRKRKSSMSKKDESDVDNANSSSDIKKSKKTQVHQSTESVNIATPGDGGPSQAKHEEHGQSTATFIISKQNGKNKMKSDPACPSLKAISKSDWLELKKKYLESQKASMSALKKQLKQKDTPEIPAGADSTQEINMIPNVVVKLNSSKTLDRTQLKSEIPEGIDVCYIDVQTGLDSGYVRCKSSNDAKLLIKNLCIDDYTLSLLQALVADTVPAVVRANCDDEVAYWNKLNQQRLETRNKTSKAKKSSKRGKQKVNEKYDKMVSKANLKKHIVFDDSDNENN